PAVHLHRGEPERRGQEPAAHGQARRGPSRPAHPGPRLPRLHCRRPADRETAAVLGLAAARPGPRVLRAAGRSVRLLRPPAHGGGARGGPPPAAGPHQGTAPPPAEGPRMSTTQELPRKHCQPCEGGIPPLPQEKVREYLEDLAGWHLTPDG